MTAGSLNARIGELKDFAAFGPSFGASNLLDSAFDTLHLVTPNQKIQQRRALNQSVDAATLGSIGLASRGGGKLPLLLLVAGAGLALFAFMRKR